MIANREINFEQDIEASLVQYGGWESVRFQDTHYDASVALDSVVLLEFVKETQPKIGNDIFLSTVQMQNRSF